MTQALNQLLAVRAPIELAAGPLRFVDQDELPAGTAYEAFIARTGRVPTRNNMHDLYNGMALLVLKNMLPGEQATGQLAVFTPKARLIRMELRREGEDRWFPANEIDGLF